MLLDLLGNPSSGGNCYLLSAADETIMIDAGLAWSSQRAVGVDFTVPRLTEEQRRNVSTVVITHPHEDHIGAITYLLDQLTTPPAIIAGPVTAAITRERLNESRHRVPVETLAPYGWAKTKQFSFQMLPVPHSASESMALYVEGPGATLLYSGDLRGSDETGYGRLPSQALTERANVDFLMLEAVRADVNEPDPTMADLKEGLLAALRKLEGRRVIVSAFASNLTRIQILIELARSLDRHCYLLGRSMHRAVQMAQQFQRMPAQAWSLGPPPKSAADSKTLLIVAGAQGEPDAGLSRLIRGHYPVQARRGDGLIMSSTPIPGNEAAFWTLVETAEQKGVEVITYRDYLVHLSGHSTASELQRIMRLVKPRWIIPFHGDYYRHAVMRELGTRSGLPPRSFVEAANGDRVDLEKPEHVKHMNWPVDCYQLAKGRQRRASRLEDVVVDERLRMLNSGTVVLEKAGGRLRPICLDCSPEVRAIVEDEDRATRHDAQVLERLEALPVPPVILQIG